MDLRDWLGTVVLVALMVSGLIAGLRDARRFHDDPADRKRDTDTTD